MQLIFSKSMDRQLFKTVPIIAPRLLDQILWQIEIQSKRPKKEGGVWKKKLSQFWIKNIQLPGGEWKNKRIKGKIKLLLRIFYEGYEYQK